MNVSKATFNELIPNNNGGGISFEQLKDIPLQLTVELGRTNKSIKEILALKKGSIIELDKIAGEPVDILCNGILIAKGEVVVIDEKFGIRLVEIKQDNLNNVIR